MNDTDIVQMLDPQDQLTNYFSSLYFFHGSILFHILEQVFSFD